jgi:hypothetical protein
VGGGGGWHDRDVRRRKKLLALRARSKLNIRGTLEREASTGTKLLNQ